MLSTVTFFKCQSNVINLWQTETKADLININKELSVVIYRICEFSSALGHLDNAPKNQ